MNDREQAIYENSIPVNETGVVHCIVGSEGVKPAFGTMSHHTGVLAPWGDKTKFANPGKAR
jgi:hypothetical protein